MSLKGHLIKLLSNGAKFRQPACLWWIARSGVVTITLSVMSSVRDMGWSLWHSHCPAFHTDNICELDTIARLLSLVQEEGVGDKEYWKLVKTRLWLVDQ